MLYNQREGILVSRELPGQELAEGSQKASKKGGRLKNCVQAFRRDKDLQYAQYVRIRGGGESDDVEGRRNAPV